MEKVVLWLERFGWSSRVRVTGDNGASVVVVVVDEVGLVEVVGVGFRLHWYSSRVFNFGKRTTAGHQVWWNWQAVEITEVAATTTMQLASLAL